MKPSPWFLTSNPPWSRTWRRKSELWARSTSSQRSSPSRSVIRVESSMSEKRIVTWPSGAAWAAMSGRSEATASIMKSIEVLTSSDAEPLRLEPRGERALDEADHAELLRRRRAPRPSSSSARSRSPSPSRSSSDLGELEPGPGDERPVAHPLADRDRVGEVALGLVGAAVGRREQPEHPRDRPVGGGRAAGDDVEARRTARSSSYRAARPRARRRGTPRSRRAARARSSTARRAAGRRSPSRGERLERRARLASWPSSAWVAASEQRQAGIAG